MPSLISNSAFDDEDHEWVADFDRYTSSKLVPGKVEKVDGVEEIEQEMKLLNWHKLANEAALKAALIKTKRLRDTDRRAIALERTKEQAQWMQQILEEEQRKPLEVTSDFISKYEAREKKEEERIESEVKRHIKSLKRLKQQLKVREETRMRSQVYREKRSQLRAMQETSASEPESNDGGFYLTAVPEVLPPPPVKKGVQGTLTKVITSLDKLVDLEKRISKLETETDYDPTKGVADRVMGNPKGRTNVVFHKKRVPSSVNRASKTTYSVSIQQGSRRVNNRRRLPKMKHDASIRNRTEAKIKLKHAKKLRAKRESERQDAVINDWLKERNKKTMVRRSRLQAKTKAISERRAAKNSIRDAPSQPQRMQQFHEIRKQFEKRKQELYRDMKPGANQGIRGRGRTKTRTRGNAARGGRSRTVTVGATGRGRSRTTKDTTISRKSRATTQPPQRRRRKTAWGGKTGGSSDRTARNRTRDNSRVSRMTGATRSRNTRSTSRKPVNSRNGNSYSYGASSNFRTKGAAVNRSTGGGRYNDKRHTATRLPIIGSNQRRRAW